MKGSGPIFVFLGSENGSRALFADQGAPLGWEHVLSVSVVLCVCGE